MMYSSALYPHPCADLEQASENKLQRICDLLDLRSGQRVLEIGGGWGGLAIFVASRYDVHVTTTTISKAQFEEAQARVALAGLEDRVDVRLEDYRDVQGVYDRVVSIEMVEAVGDEFLDGYFRQVENLLLPGGRFVMQAITIQDQRYAAALREVDFIKKHIFPGSFIPSVSRLVNAAGRTRTMKLIALDDIGEHYARTLAAWSQRFAAARDQLDALGFDGRFQRLWRFYFSYCEGGFLEQAISDVQMVFGTAPHPLSVELC
jgi:cyclopropane-fatty-acyl-phospholipid synthase